MDVLECFGVLFCRKNITDHKAPRNKNYQVPLLPAIGSSTGMAIAILPSMALEEGGHGVMNTGGWSSQDPNPIHVSKTVKARVSRINIKFCTNSTLKALPDLSSLTHSA